MKNTHTVLIVEDDQFLARLYASFFENKGYKVIIEPEGEQGLYRMRRGSVDIVLLDIVMPKKSGFDVLIERQKDETLSKIPVIVLSSLEQEDDENFAKQLGADDFFTKGGVELDVLLGKVLKLLSS